MRYNPEKPDNMAQVGDHIVHSNADYHNLKGMILLENEVKEMAVSTRLVPLKIYKLAKAKFPGYDFPESLRKKARDWVKYIRKESSKIPARSRATAIETTTTITPATSSKTTAIATAIAHRTTTATTPTTPTIAPKITTAVNSTVVSITTTAAIAPKTTTATAPKTTTATTPTMAQKKSTAITSVSATVPITTTATTAAIAPITTTSVKKAAKTAVAKKPKKKNGGRKHQEASVATIIKPVPFPLLKTVDVQTPIAVNAPSEVSAETASPTPNENVKPKNEPQKKQVRFSVTPSASDRPKRAAAPSNLQEVSLNKKMRR